LPFASRHGAAATGDAASVMMANADSAIFSICISKRVFRTADYAHRDDVQHQRTTLGVIAENREVVVAAILTGVRMGRRG
jgi:hypothetical protein